MSITVFSECMDDCCVGFPVNSENSMVDSVACVVNSAVGREECSYIACEALLVASEACRLFRTVTSDDCRVTSELDSLALVVKSYVGPELCFVASDDASDNSLETSELFSEEALVANAVSSDTAPTASEALVVSSPAGFVE